MFHWDRPGAIDRQNDRRGPPWTCVGGRRTGLRNKVLAFPAHSRSPAVNTSRILVVDDEPQLRRALRSTLCALGFVVADAERGEDALEIVRAEKFDLILLDINMPGLSGLETCRAIPARSDVGILMLTVRHRAEYKFEALDSR